MMQHTTEAQKVPIDVASATVLLGAWTELLPPIVSLVTLVWFLIRIWETDTVQKLVCKLRSKK